MSYSRVDLHVHSSASDGRYRPEELVAIAVQRGIVAIALTDHDTTDGVAAAKAAATNTGLEVIPGVEISTDVPQGEVHLLGYYLDCDNVAFQAWLAEMRRARRQRAREILGRLATLGVPVGWDRVLALAGGGSIGRPHIAQAMLESGLVGTLNEAFVRYIGRDGPAYVERARLVPEEAIRLVLEAGGVPVLAHPRWNVELIPSLVRVGLMGLEVYYHGYSTEEVNYLTRLARKHGLITTGGSDFHAPGVAEDGDLGGTWVPEEAVARLREKAGLPKSSLPYTF
jgi:predicted metal-dependent phosphoesterase TrpH